MRVQAVLLGLALAYASNGCATGKLGLFDAPAAPEPPHAYVLFQSQPADHAQANGSISATLSDGTRYQGKYLQVTPKVGAAAFKPAWEGFRPYWPDWTGSADLRSFRERFADKVVANVASSDGKHRLRCRFDLKDPSAGLSAGATGECQSTEHELIDGVIMPQQ